LALFAAYVTFTGLTDQYFKAPVLAMLFVGNDTGCSSALAMNSVGKAAMDMVYEVRRQSGKFLELWKVLPEYAKCVIFLPKPLYAK
jgi:K(+)-stimulated pyrophosphate-energized sodium pump